jgi:hypothetical protein
MLVLRDVEGGSSSGAVAWRRICSCPAPDTVRSSSSRPRCDGHDFARITRELGETAASECVPILLHEAGFIVARRPGWSLADVANGVPERVRIKAQIAGSSRGAPATGDFVLGRSTLDVLATVIERTSAIQVGAALAAAIIWSRSSGEWSSNTSA